MEGGVSRDEELDSNPKNFHLSKQTGESHGNSESNSESAPLCSQHTARLRSRLLLLKGQKHSSQKAQRGSPMCILIMGWRTKHLDCVPKYTKTLIEISAASLGRGQEGKERREEFSKVIYPREEKGGRMRKQDFRVTYLQTNSHGKETAHTVPCI